MKKEWETTELWLVNGELRWAVIRHKVITILRTKPSWWQRLRYCLVSTASVFNPEFECSSYILMMGGN